MSAQAGLACLLVVVPAIVQAQERPAGGEPAEAFLNQLRSGGYFEMAIMYLDRLEKYPGVKPELIQAVPLEKAQTLISAAVQSSNAKERDQFFVDAEKQLSEFTKQSSHPRIAEARAQLGRLQMVRASQLMANQPNDGQREQARLSFLEAAKTFDAIGDELTVTLKEIQGQKIDDASDPEAAARRDQYRSEFLQAKFDAAETRRMAAETYKDPAKEGEKLLSEAITRFTDLFDKYGQKYPIGANALYYTGRCQELLGKDKEAMDRYMLMLEQVDADPLREAKFQALSGAIRLWLKQSPPKYDDAITRGAEMVKSVRRNEEEQLSVQELRLHLAKAYLAKSKDESQKGPDQKAAMAEGRKLLVSLSKIAGPQLAETKELLSGLGFEATKVELPKAEPPKSLDDAIAKTRELLGVTESLRQTLEVLSNDPQASPDVEQQKQSIEKQLAESSGVGILILRGGLAMVTRGSDFEKVNEARQLLTYLLYQEKRYREAAVVGRFLARTSPGSDIGLKGGLLALNSLQLLLREVPEESNAGLIDQVDGLGKFLTKTWPNDPDASAAQGVMVRLALSKDRWDEARSLIEKTPTGPQQSSFYRLLGQLIYNESVKQRRDGDDTKADSLLKQAQQDLTKGLDSIEGGLIEPEVLQAALVLSKIQLKLDDAKAALAVLDHAKYGPLKRLKELGAPNEQFEGDLYSTELQVLVQLMIATDQDPSQLLERATQTMESLRKSFSGADGQARLSATYLRMATSIREQLDTSTPARREQLIGAFRVFLNRIAETTSDPDTLAWVGQTLMQMGESTMLPTDTKATGQSAELIQSAVDTFSSLLEKSKEKPLAQQYQIARGQRLLGNYKATIDTLVAILTEKPMMLDAQTEAALAYEQWAGSIDPKFASKAYESAINGARPGADGKNVIWGWGKISQLTSSNPQFKDKFFDARYHLASCRYLMGKAANSKEIMRIAISDITKVASLYPELGGAEQRKRYDSLMKTIQREVGQQPTGLPAPAANKPAPAANKPAPAANKSAPAAK